MFNPDHFYRPNDAAMRVIASVPTLAKWRCHGEGPSYHKASKNILYRGQDILDWIDASRVETAA